MKRKIELNWGKQMVFTTESNGHKITLDGYNKDVGGENNGPPPKPMMLVALGGCILSEVDKIYLPYRK